jgi:hypothetical protein
MPISPAVELNAMAFSSSLDSSLFTSWGRYSAMNFPVYHALGGGKESEKYLVPYVSFTRTSAQYVDLTPITFDSGISRGFTYIAYMRLTDATPTSNFDTIFSCFSNSAGTTFSLFREGNANYMTLTARFDPWFSKSFNHPYIDEWGVLAARYDPDSIAFDFIVDGYVFGLTLSSIQSLDSASPFDSCNFGKDYSSNQYMSADVAAFYVYERPLTNAEIASVTSYLKSLSGLVQTVQHYHLPHIQSHIQHTLYYITLHYILL